jgi:tRNA(Ile)-lysidine synthase
LARGAGTRGLAGIYPRLAVSESQFPDLEPRRALSPGASIVRPLLAESRRELESYLNALKQDWREDSSNRKLEHSRNRVRHEILPLLEQRLNPAVRRVLAETAEIARAEEEHWQQAVNSALPEIFRPAAGHGEINTAALLQLPLALQRRVVRAAAQALGLRLEFGHVEEILAVARGDSQAAALPSAWTVSNSIGRLRIEPKSSAEFSDYEYSLPVPGQVEVAEAGIRLETRLVPQAGRAAYNPENLLDAAAIGQDLRVRNWRPGDLFWPAHSKSPKKIKELLQQRHLSGRQRKLWPVVVNGAQVVWLRGFRTPAELSPRSAIAQAVVIREIEE